MRSPIWVTLLLAIGIAGCGGDSNSERSQLTLPGPKARVDHDAVAAGAWTVRASTVPAAIGPVVFAASDLRRAETTDSHPWLQHKLGFRNTGDLPAIFEDTRSSAFAGAPMERRLLVADEGCGYARNTPSAPVRAGSCLGYLDRLTLRPHDAATRSVTLYEGLPGMKRLRPGTYVFRHPVRFRVGITGSDTAERYTGVVKLVYEVKPRSY